jgi:hypothetical protein
VDTHLLSASADEHLDFWDRMTAIYNAGPTLSGCTGFAQPLDRIKSDSGFIQYVAVKTKGHIGIVKGHEGPDGPFVVIAAIELKRILRRICSGKSCLVHQNTVTIDGDAYRIDLLIDPHNCIQLSRFLNFSVSGYAPRKCVTLDLGRANVWHRAITVMVA